MIDSNTKNNHDEPCGSRNFEEKEAKIIETTKSTLHLAYKIYWEGLNLIKDTINLLIEDAIKNPSNKFNLAYLMLINRSVQHIESIRLLTERGLYGNSFVLLRGLMSDLSMMQYLHFHPELLDLFLDEKQDDYQMNKNFKKFFSESAVESDLVNRGTKPFGPTFQLLSKASHSSSFGSQLFGSKGKQDGQYHFNYGPKFQPEKGLMLLDLVASSHYDLVNNVLWHRHHSGEEIDTPEWEKVKENLRSLKSKVEIHSDAAKMTVEKFWPK